MAPPLKYPIRLSEEEQLQLKTLTTTGVHAARTIKRAQILLMSHEGKTIQHITDVLDIAPMTVNNIRKKYFTEGMNPALYERPRPGRPCTFDGKDRAAITGIACSEVPAGHAKWSVRLIAYKAVEIHLVDSISPTTVHYILKKTKSSRTAKGRGA